MWEISDLLHFHSWTVAFPLRLYAHKNHVTALPLQGLQQSIRALLDTMSSGNKANDGRKQQTEDDFETVNHEDAETPGNTERKSPTTTKDDLSLTRFDNRNQEEEDDSDDEPAMAHHPIFGMLAGRLGQRRRGSTHKYDKLHPENQVLSLAHIEDCVEVESSAFPENERASREKVIQISKRHQSPI